MAFEKFVFGLSLCLTVSLTVTDAQITKTSFSCDGRVSGYYADVGTGCQVYHMCDGLGRKFSFVCPNATLFQQRMLICDHWFMVNCSRSESDYSANLLIGQKGKPFVGENGKSSFQRTPRPDYVSVDSDQSEAVYENTVEHSDDLNLVGVNSDDDNQGGSKQYNPPSRWSTEYNKISPTNDPKNQPPRRQDVDGTNIVERTTTRIIADRLSNKYDTEVRDGNSEVINNPVVNFQSRYKATTPVYPTFVEESLKLKNIELAPPKTQPKLPVIEDINNLQIKESSPSFVHRDEEPNHVNFESKFKATTPVYPTSVDDALKLNNVELSPPVIHNKEEQVANEEQSSNSENSIKVNFESNFKATTPVYPTSVDDALKQNNFELLSPLAVDGESKQEEFVKVNFVSNFKATTPVYPLSVESTSPVPDAVGLLPPLDDDVEQVRHLPEQTTRAPVNFESNFAATIPNYPLSVEATSPVPDSVGLLPPYKNDLTGRVLNFEPKEEDGQQIRRKDEEPSQYYEPPLFSTGYVNPNGALFNYRTSNKHVVIPKIDDWNELRKRFSVPEFEFPLDSDIRRASYESDLSSFQPRPAGLQQR
ncbi:hypothetical protein WA026_005912 [Henosepilachna vigintioctopunctata]|uniref:Chitin-binding type-2 domain-containing protein n=1 Tax=Henosepilachna vigintioctopunctata TaxID=420089 RepID=A0AAW1U3J4_9CUCU